MTGYMYILKCYDGSYYTGSTVDLERRLWQHQNGQGANYTKNRLPVELVYCEEYDRIDEAFYREKQVQGWAGLVEALKGESLDHGSHGQKDGRDWFFDLPGLPKPGCLSIGISNPNSNQATHFKRL